MKYKTCNDFLKVCDGVIKDLDLNTDNKDAKFLLLCTCIHESKLGKYNRQLGKSGKPLENLVGGFGIMQIEIETRNLIYEWLLKNKKRSALLTKLNNLISTNESDLHNLRHNDKYSIALARLLYLSISEKLPNRNNIKEVANYWSKYYNRGGKEKLESFMNSMKEFGNELSKTTI